MLPRTHYSVTAAGSANRSIATAGAQPELPAARVVHIKQPANSAAAAVIIRAKRGKRASTGAISAQAVELRPQLDTERSVGVERCIIRHVDLGPAEADTDPRIV